MNTLDSQSIVTRFFQCINALHASKELRFIISFTDKYEIDRRTFYLSERKPDSNRFQVAWLVYLINDYGVSPTLLLTGKDPAVSRAFLEVIDKIGKPQKTVKNPIIDAPAVDIRVKYKKEITALRKNPDSTFPVKMLITLAEDYGVGVSGVLRGGKKKSPTKSRAGS